MMWVAVIGDRYFANKHLVWQVVRDLPDGVTVVLGAMRWAGEKVAEGAAASRGFPVVRLAAFIEQIDTLLLFSDTEENGGAVWEIVRQVRKRGLHVETYTSASEPRLARLQMRLFE